jgi:hypothetical protein
MWLATSNLSELFEVRDALLKLASRLLVLLLELV